MADTEQTNNTTQTENSNQATPRKTRKTANSKLTAQNDSEPVSPTTTTPRKNAKSRRRTLDSTKSKESIENITTPEKSDNKTEPLLQNSHDNNTRIENNINNIFTKNLDLSQDKDTEIEKITGIEKIHSSRSRKQNRIAKALSSVLVANKNEPSNSNDNNTVNDENQKSAQKIESDKKTSGRRAERYRVSNKNSTLTSSSLLENKLENITENQTVSEVESVSEIGKVFGKALEKVRGRSKGARGDKADNVQLRTRGRSQYREHEVVNFPVETQDMPQLWDNVTVSDTIDQQVQQEKTPLTTMPPDYPENSDSNREVDIDTSPANVVIEQPMFTIISSSNDDNIIPDTLPTNIDQPIETEVQSDANREGESQTVEEGIESVVESEGEKSDFIDDSDNEQSLGTLGELFSLANINLSNNDREKDNKDEQSKSQRNRRLQKGNPQGNQYHKSVLTPVLPKDAIQKDLSSEVALIPGLPQDNNALPTKDTVSQSSDTVTSTPHDLTNSTNLTLESQDKQLNLADEYLDYQDEEEIFSLEDAFRSAVVQPSSQHHRRRNGRRYHAPRRPRGKRMTLPSRSTLSATQYNDHRRKQPVKSGSSQNRLMEREMQRAEEQLEIVARNRQLTEPNEAEPKTVIHKRDSDIRENTERNTTTKTRNNPYPVDEFSSIEMMSSLNGFAPMGMLFVLMDILKGHEEGLIHVNQLSQALNIGKPSLLAQLENLEAAGLLRTISSSRAGRHIELLTPNLLQAMDVFPVGTTGNLRTPGQDDTEVGGQFSRKRLEMLYHYLEKHGIEVVSIPDERKMPPTVPRLAAFMGKYYPCLQKFYERLKATLTAGEEFQYSLAGLPNRNITHTLSFCRMLRDAGFLSDFAYHKAPYYNITARVSRDPVAINFLTGGWLEHYVRDKVISVLTTHPVTLSMPYAFMKNPNITLPGGEQFELDFLLCVGERIFWIEAKTGEYMNFLPKYSRVSRLLGLSRITSMLVSVDPLNTNDRLTSRYNLSCCNLDEFPDVFRINLVRELQQQAVQSVMA